MATRPRAGHHRLCPSAATGDQDPACVPLGEHPAMSMAPRSSTAGRSSALPSTAPSNCPASMVGRHAPSAPAPAARTEVLDGEDPRELRRPARVRVNRRDGLPGGAIPGRTRPRVLTTRRARLGGLAGWSPDRLVVASHRHPSAPSACTPCQHDMTNRSRQLTTMARPERGRSVKICVQAAGEWLPDR